MGQGESRIEELPFEATIDYEPSLEDDAQQVGFAASEAQQAESTLAAADAAATAAVLNLGPLQLEAKLETTTEPELEPAKFKVSTIEERISDYHLEAKVLGEGGFGMVKLATSKKTGHKVAVKIIKRKKLNERSEELLRREVKHHEKLKHPNIVRLYISLKTPQRYFLVMECCAQGDLLNYLNERKKLQDDEVRWFFRQLLDGLTFCHGIGMYHRDLKLENLLLTASGAPDEAGPKWANLDLKIADFGLSDLQPFGPSKTYCGSPLYAAPELLSGARDAGYDASKSDMWSCGVILYALLASALPFDANDMQELVHLVRRGRPSRKLPPSRGKPAAELVSRLLTVDPSARPTAEETATSEWVVPPMKSVKTTPELPAHDDEELEEGEADAGAAAAPRRKGVSETADFFKQMLAREREKAEKAEAIAEAPAAEERTPGAVLTAADLAMIRAEQKKEEAAAAASEAVDVA